jgi:two-component system chemotaxis response regulator CheY
MLKKVLIVDDSEPLHQIYKVTLKRYHCETVTALKREEGLKKLAENSDVNLILVDMNMLLSRVSGLDFIKKVKAEEAYKNTPIIIVTTKGNEYQKEALALADGNLVKPFISKEIHSLVEKLFPQAASA